MNPFNINLAKQGKPVCTRDGREVRIICFDAKNEKYPIVALVMDDGEERARSFTSKGYYFTDEIKRNNDLMMATEKKRGWMHIYKYDDGSYGYIGEIYETKEQADRAFKADNYVSEIPVAWEE